MPRWKLVLLTTGLVFPLAAANAAEPRAYWRFEAPGGATVVDSGPNGLNGTLNGLPVRISDVPVDPVPLTEVPNTQSLDMNWQSTSSGGRFNVVDPMGLLSFGDSSFTIEAWVRLDHVSDTSGAGQRQYLCQKKANAGPDTDLDYGFIVQAGDLGSSGSELALRYGDGSSVLTQVSSLTITDLDWHHVSLAYDAEVGELRFGVDATFQTIAFAKPDHTNVGPLRVGAHQNSAGDHNHFLRGTMDELRIVDRFSPVDLLLTGAPTDCNDNGVADLVDIASGTSTDCNNNCVPDECDISSGTSQDCQGDGIPDECQLDGSRYAWDDSEGDANVRADGVSMAWLNNFTVTDDQSTITHIDVAIGNGFVGDPATLYVWSDPNGDGDPTDATVLTAQPITLIDGIIDLNDDSLFDIPDTFVGPNGTSFFVGIILDFLLGDGDFPARYDFGDQPPVLGVSWVVGALDVIDPNDLSNLAVEFDLVEDAGLPDGNWVLQAVTGLPNDCNGNGVPDNCEIDDGAPDCNGNGIPDDCELGVNDCNLNGIPDECDIASGTSDDADMDGVPDECPLASICVPLQSPTIQGAIVAAGDGTVITVKDGTYPENIEFLGKAITVVSENGPATTTIDGGGAGSVVSFVSGEPNDTVLEGFTLTGGSGTPGAGGGGVIVLASDPTIRGNVIINNVIDGFGGGILAFGGSAPRIIDNHIEGNIAAAGGGIHAEPNNNAVRIQGNQVIGNSVNGNGGGVFFFNGTAELVGNVIADNMANDSGGGLFVLLTGNTTPIVVSNVFRNNQASGNGGGIWMDTTNPIVVNNLIVGNSAQSGGGIYADNSGTFANNTIVENAAGAQAGGFFNDNGSFTIVNSIIRGNTAPMSPEIADDGSAVVAYCNILGGWPGTGNIDADPLFVDVASNDYRLSAGSPCVDAGDSTAVPEDLPDLDADGDTTERMPLDLAGLPRFGDDPATSDSGVADPPTYPQVVEIGAYELTCAGDTNGDNIVDVADLVQVVLNWGVCPGCSSDVNGDGVVDVADLVVIILGWGPCS